MRSNGIATIAKNGNGKIEAGRSGRHPRAAAASASRFDLRTSALFSRFGPALLRLHRRNQQLRPIAFIRDDHPDIEIMANAPG